MVVVVVGWWFWWGGWFLGRGVRNGHFSGFWGVPPKIVKNGQKGGYPKRGSKKAFFRGTSPGSPFNFIGVSNFDMSLIRGGGVPPRGGPPRGAPPGGYPTPPPGHGKNICDARKPTLYSCIYYSGNLSRGTSTYTKNMMSNTMIV